MVINASMVRDRKVYDFSFPVPNSLEELENGDIRYQHIYIEANRCPNKEELITILQHLIDKWNNSILDYDVYDLRACINCLNHICDIGGKPQDFPNIQPRCSVSTVIVEIMLYDEQQRFPMSVYERSREFIQVTF